MRLGLKLLLMIVSLLTLQGASAATEGLLTLGTVDGEVQPDASIITIRLNGKPKWETVALEEHGTFLQITLPDTLVSKPGEFFETNSPYIPKAVALQIGGEKAAIRLIVSKDAAAVLKSSTADVLEDRVVFRLDHTELNKILDAKIVPDHNGKPLPSAAEVIEKISVDNDLPQPALLLQTAKPAVATTTVAAVAAPAIAEPLKEAATETVGVAAPIAGYKVPDIRQKLVGIAAFSGFMLIVLMLLYFLKPYLRGRRHVADSANDYTIRVLSTQTVAPKQKLTIVQVGNQKLLLAMTPNGINLISRLDEPQYQPQQAPGTLQLARKPAAALPAQRQAAPANDISLKKLSLGRESMAAQPAPAAAQPAKKVARPAPAAPKNEPRRTANPGPSIEFAVGDEGAIAVRRPSAPSQDKSAPPSLEDVRRLIREKLRNLPA